MARRLTYDARVIAEKTPLDIVDIIGSTHPIVQATEEDD
jgi:hypothetical protein